MFIIAVSCPGWINRASRPDALRFSARPECPMGGLAQVLGGLRVATVGDLTVGGGLFWVRLVGAVVEGDFAHEAFDAQSAAALVADERERGAERVFLRCG